MPTSSLDSSADDGFLGGSLIMDAESGTVTAKAISSEDYYAEVRRQLEKEAVIAVDVIPLNEDGRPTEPRLNRRNRDRSGPNKNPKVKLSHPSIRNYILLGVGIGLLAILVVLFLIFNANSGDTSPSFVAPPTPQIDNTNNNGVSYVNPDTTDNSFDNNFPDENDINQNEITSNPDVLDDDMAEMIQMMEGETAGFWRRQFANILPSETLVDLVSDKMYMTPVGKALVFLVENAESLFIIDNMKDYSLSPEEESRASTIFALVTIYYSLNGPDWFVRKNWLDANVDICEWHGVACKGDLLPKATIAETAIIGEKEGDTNKQLPPEFENFVPLPPGDVIGPTATFGDDNFDRDIFINGVDDDGNEEDGDENYYYDFNTDGNDEYFSDKIAIHSLNLKANGLTGYFPRELSLLINIYDTIDLSVNEIAGSIPTHLGLLSKLQNIMLQQNKLESSLPTELGSMTDLKAFDISGNFEINGTFPVGLDQWKGIERLEIQNTNMKGIVREKFCNMVYERTSPRNEFFYMNQYEWDGTFFFRASCPSPLACPCCTQCCHEDINGKDVCGPILELDYSEDD
jgi:Leucine-rich repeat (LRR) protein